MDEEIKQLHIVIADNEPLIAMNLSEILRSKGAQVVGLASDGFEAVALCRRHQVDVVLLDVKMPLLDGFSAAQIISEENLADTIIMVTAFSEEELINKATAIGVAGYLVKPVDEKMLIPCIKVGRARSAQLRMLKKKVNEATDALEARKIIERAKGLVIREQNLTEQEAYRYIRQISKDKCISMKEVSEMILRSAQP